MTATTDRWHQMAQSLAGEPLPPPPPLLPGRVHRQPWPTGADALAAAHDALDVRLAPGWRATVGQP